MSIIEALTITGCVAILAGIVRFSALAFWPDHPITQLFTGNRAR